MDASIENSVQTGLENSQTHLTTTNGSFQSHHYFKTLTCHLCYVFTIPIQLEEANKAKSAAEEQMHQPMQFDEDEREHHDMSHHEGITGDQSELDRITMGEKNKNLQQQLQV